jgi:thymidylate synthase ThyX
MKPEVTLILASIANGVPIYTFQLRYWRAIHAEFMTHRVFSRNASSSRAIPVDRMLEVVRQAPAGPIHWGANQPGMQADHEHEALIEIPNLLTEAFYSWAFKAKEIVAQFPLASREQAWAFSAHLAASMSDAFSQAGYHKQVANRITEPFQAINVVVTSTEWENFFDLRCHKDAMPEIRELAEQIQQKLLETKPMTLAPGSWHLPYILPEETVLPLGDKLALSAARCASVSYRTVEGSLMELDRAKALFEKLVGSQPLHASPMEHQAKVHKSGELPDFTPSNLAYPWIQHRKFLEAAVTPT